MNYDMKSIGRWIKRFVVFIIIFIFIMTWLYPYSTFSVYKSYSYKPYDISFNGKSYKEIVSDFKDSYEKDLHNKYSNLTINRTQYVLPIFEQDWLISKDSVSIDVMKLDTMLFEVKQVREVLLNLVVEEDYTSEQRGYLIDIIKNLLSLEESIIELKNANYVTRSELNRRLDNLYREFTNNFRFYITFYGY